MHSQVIAVVVDVVNKFVTVRELVAVKEFLADKKNNHLLVFPHDFSTTKGAKSGCLLHTSTVSKI